MLFMRSHTGVPAFAAFCLAALPTVATAQAPPSATMPCASAPLTIPAPKQPIALTVEQEVDLGDAIAEHLQQFFRVVDDDAALRLQAIGDRIVQQLPQTNYRFRFLLVNQPTANAFALTGGRIYVTRKLVAYTRSEDELAGILAHEIGHIVTRQLAAGMSRQFRDTLQVTTFGDRRDVFDKYAQLVERRTRTVRQNLQHDQIEADQLALLATARAGYSPAAYVEFWDRFAETEQRTGNFFTDLLGATRPESRRLRELLRTLTTMPEACRAPATPVADESFETWRRRVIAASGRSPAESLRAVVADTKLEPPLSSELTHLAFSPDGRFVLAQDDSSIHVLSREPFAVLFRIDAEDAERARFTPDSSSVVFNTSALRVESWDIATRARRSVHELVVRSTCVLTALSPDGGALGCLDDNLSLLLFDVAEGRELFRKPRAYRLTIVDPRLAWVALRFTPFQLAFSPDGRYFIVGHESGETVVDVTERREAKLAAPVRTALRQSFAFLGPDRLVTVDPRRPEQSAILRFPSGEVEKQVTLRGRVEAVTKGDAVVVRPIRDWALGLVDLNAGGIVMASRRDVFDAWDTFRITEQPNGEVALFDNRTDRPVAVTTLPQARLGRLRAVDVSPDLKWVAFSGRERGAMWSVETGARVAHLRAFNGVHVGDSGAMVADFPRRNQVQEGKVVEHPRTIVRLDLASNQTRDLTVVKEEDGRQLGAFFLVRTPANPDEPNRDVTLDVRDARTGAVLWTRLFAGDAPFQYPDAMTRRLVLEWSVSSQAARRSIEQDAALRAQVSADKLKAGDAYLEVLDLETGRLVGRLLVNTGRDSFRIRTVSSSRDAVTVVDRNNQVFVHSLASGARRGAAFGQFAVPSDAAGLVCVQNEPTEVDCYDATSMEHQAEIRLAASVRVIRFSDDGKRLLIVTSDQMAKVFDTAALRTSAR
jgi:hypothetical protein